MKHLYFFLIGIAMVCGCMKNEKGPAKTLPEKSDLYAELMNASAAYDSSFAQKLGSDQRGMKPYVLAFLKKGPNRSQDSVTAANLQKAHMENIGRMAEAGKLVLAGPFTDDGELRGLYIFNVATLEEARELTASDPAIQAGRLVMELHTWYGSAVLPVLPALHRRLDRSSVIR